jgi:NADH dehydrogenase
MEAEHVICDKSLVEYDVAVIATGAAQNYFGIKGAERTFSVGTLEEAKRAKNYLESRSPHKVVIIGSGLTGVETACALVDRLDACICVLESKNRALPQFSANVSSFMERALAEKGIHLMLSAYVREIEEDCMKLSNGSTLDFDMAIWTAGIKPSPFVDRLAYPKKNDEWILTNSCLQAFDNVFALGDSAWIEIGGKVASKTAVEAEHQAKQTCQEFMALCRRKSPKRICDPSSHRLPRGADITWL